MENIREHIVNRVAELDTNSHQEIFNFIKRFDANFTQNNNGMFVDLNTMTEEELYELCEKIDQLIDSNEACFVFDNEDSYTDVDNLEAVSVCEDVLKYETDKSPLLNKTIESSAIKHFDALSNKLTKKNAHNKFSVIKKKYNKQVIIDHLHKKLDDSDLNELCVEEYIIPGNQTDEHTY